MEMMFDWNLIFLLKNSIFNRCYSLFSGIFNLFVYNSISYKCQKFIEDPAKKSNANIALEKFFNAILILILDYLIL